ncbi:MAG TPA: XRE family transcriptional regulator [Streptosporangiaceae bacterium]|nr:XRE family transcriptional regulator [Streptosporangiaceae bacterium]
MPADAPDDDGLRAQGPVPPAAQAPGAAAAPGTPSGVAALIAASLRRERDRAGLSLSELARRAGIAKSTLSQLESGTGNPSVETLWALGVALGVPFSRLVDPARPGVRVIRADEGPVIYAEHASYAATLLTSCSPGARHDIYRLRTQPGEPRISDPHMPGTMEHLVVSTGRALAGPIAEPVEVAAGDYVSYPGDVPHIFRAQEPDTTAVMILEHI